MKIEKKKLSATEKQEMIQLLHGRFMQNEKLQEDLDWNEVEKKLLDDEAKLYSLWLMENTGGEPQLVYYDRSDGAYYFYDCAKESPVGRRSLCYDQEALEARKANKPEGSAVQMAKEMGIELLDEEGYSKLQEYGEFDNKTSSWLLTPAVVREKGGAIFGDLRYGRIFIYHNGADSYYGARGFRGRLKL